MKGRGHPASGGKKSQFLQTPSSPPKSTMHQSADDSPPCSPTPSKRLCPGAPRKTPATRPKKRRISVPCSVHKSPLKDVFKFWDEAHNNPDFPSFDDFANDGFSLSTTKQENSPNSGVAVRLCMMDSDSESADAKADNELEKGELNNVMKNLEDLTILSDSSQRRTLRCEPETTQTERSKRTVRKKLAFE